MKPELIALKRATAEMLKGVGGLEAAAGFCRVGKSQLGDYQNQAKAETFIPVDIVAEIEPLARDRDGWPHVTRALCAAMGGMFVPRPEVSVPREDLLGSIARLAKENSDIAAAILTGLADGRLDVAEAHAALEQVREGQNVLADLAAQLIAIAGDAA